MSSPKHHHPIEPLEQRMLLSLTPTLSGVLPSIDLIAGRPNSGIHQVVHLTNDGSDTVIGKTTITLQLSPDPAEDSNAVNLVSISRQLHLKMGKTITVPIGVRSLPLAPTGTVFLLAAIIDPAGASTFATGGSINVVPPTIDLSPLVVTPPVNAKPGKKGVSRVTITNTGNIPAVGNLAIDLQASISGAIDSSSIDLGLTTKHIAIGPNKKAVVSVPATFPSTGGPFFIVANVDQQNTFSEISTTNNQLSSLMTILGQTETTRITKGALTVKLSPLATVPSEDGTPQDIVTAPGLATTQFVATRDGKILTLMDGTLSTTPFLDVAAAGVTIYTGGEGGLLGLAFSPTFSTPNTFGFEKFYTFDTEPFAAGDAADFSSPELFPTTNTAPNNKIVIREWTVPSPTSLTANVSSRVLLTIDHPQSNHQGGALRFGPDGDLYIGLGDGGGANDENGSATDPSDGHTNSSGNAQDPNVVFGKILRINPDPSAGAGFVASANNQYSIPVSNPFSKGGGVGEIYAMGLRNPFRFSFDSKTGNLYVGNVGQGNIESVDIVTAGGNYGWPFFEGSRNNQADTGRTAPVGFTFTTPIAEYTHNDGIAIIGGEVDRNPADGALNGEYIFGDLGASVGRLFYTSSAGGTISEFNYDSSGVMPTASLYGFGVADAGNVEALFADGEIVTFSVVG
jgi:hypothetical protein